MKITPKILHLMRKILRLFLFVLFLYFPGILLAFEWQPIEMKNSGEHYEISIAYPEFIGQSPEVKFFNSIVKQFIDAQMDEAFANVDAMRPLWKEGTTSLPVEHTCSWTLYEGQSLYSLQFDIYSYTGGAHGNSHFNTYHFNSELQLLSFEEIFMNDAVEFFEAEIDRKSREKKDEICRFTEYEVDLSDAEFVLDGEE